MILLSAGLRPLGYETRLVVGTESPREGNMLPLAAEKNVTCEAMAGLGREIAPLSDLRALVGLHRLMRAWRPAIVHTHTAKAGLLGRLAARAAGVPTVVHTYHGHVLRGYFSPAKTALFRWLETRLATAADALVAVSEAVKQDLVGLGIARGRQDPRRPARPRPRPPRRRAAAGRAAARGGDPRGRRRSWGWWAASCRSRTRPRSCGPRGSCARSGPDARFALVGDGEERPALESLCRELGLDGKVTFFGWRRDLAAVYGDLDVVVNASRNEGTPVALIEALAAARPVVATRVGGTPDLLGEGERGRLVPPGEPEALARAVLETLDESEAARRSRAGRSGARPRAPLGGPPGPRRGRALPRAARGEEGGLTDTVTTALIPIGVLVVAFALSAALVPAAGWLARRYGVIDDPGPRKVHRAPTPRIGGIAVWAAFTLVVLAGYFGVPVVSRLPWVRDAPRGARGHAAGGLPRRGEAHGAPLRRRDRVRGRPPRRRAGQPLQGGPQARAARSSPRVVLVAGGIRTDFLYYDALNVAFTLLWVVGITNAFNLLDNMDGLSAGVAFVASLVLLVNAWILGEFFISLVLVALMGSLLGFLVYNWHPASIFLGDCGSLFIGFTLASLTLAPALRLPRLLEHLLPGPDAGAGARAADPRHRHRHLHPPARGPAHLRRRQPPPLPPPRLARHAPAARGLHDLPHRPRHRPRRRRASPTPISSTRCSSSCRPSRSWRWC